MRAQVLSLWYDGRLVCTSLFLLGLCVAVSKLRLYLAINRCECIDTVTTAYAWLQDLAAASQEQVNGVWAGLGYYRRARLLLEGAQHVQANLSGKIPINSVELQKIPGVPFNSQVLHYQ